MTGMEVTTGAETGLWGASLTERAATVPLDTDLTVDFAIIGAGFTGCAAALEASRLGASVAVLEARTVGFGGSGRNVGLVNAGLWLPPETIIAQMGGSDGRRLIDALGAGPDRVFEIIERESIDCEATRAGTLHLAHTPSGKADLRRRHRQANAFGSVLHLLNSDEARRRTGSSVFHGALWNPKAGTIQPLAYCHGLARAAMRIGARIYSDTPVQAAEWRDGVWVLRSGQYIVRARALLQATNAYDTAWTQCDAPRYVTVNYSQFATVPLPAEALQTVLPGKEGCWDTALVMSSIRLDRSGRLIIGGMGNSNSRAGRIHAGWARRKLKALYPALADIPFEHEWSGRIAMAADHLPKVQVLGPSGLSIFGYSGRGIAPGTVFGSAAARYLVNKDETALPLPVSDDHSETMTGARAAYYELGATIVHALGARFRVI
ncbi:FAD-binding oxidoreductase [Notoacmeibacter sp. MSK16QG-6]|uniref:NAD(P)/FAD-dependent oxidoreductase n=1 Tax=Notoacmeibacter sp. MSK16QG-6 TaxID=2957982 RepID=UPI00209C787D|nr:FAD-binding oxidoreductase [Notoacmeibacter sp. MSK16QG-6]